MHEQPPSLNAHRFLSFMLHGCGQVPAEKTCCDVSPVLAAAVRQIMDRRKLKAGKVMRELGMDPLDASLCIAIPECATSW